MKCKAKRYLNRTKVTTSCEAEAEYGCLCGVHARQISGTPLGFSFNRVRRIHLPDLTDDEVQESMKIFLEQKGEVIPQLADPMKYLNRILLFIEEHGRATSGEIIDHIMTNCKNSDMSASKVGSVLRVLKARGKVKRTLCSVTIDGRRKGSSYYELV